MRGYIGLCRASKKIRASDPSMRAVLFWAHIGSTFSGHSRMKRGDLLVGGYLECRFLRFAAKA